MEEKTSRLSPGFPRFPDPKTQVLETKTWGTHPPTNSWSGHPPWPSWTTLRSSKQKSETCYRLPVDEPRKSAIIAVCASILAARKLAAVPRSTPVYVAAIADVVAGAKRIVEWIEQESHRR